jgi:hypothetical protein
MTVVRFKGSPGEEGQIIFMLGYLAVIGKRATKKTIF